MSSAAGPGFMHKNRAIILDFLWPTLVLGLIILIHVLYDPDLFVSGLFYRPDEGWYLAQANPWYFLYHYGMVPAFVLASGGLIVFLGGFFLRPLRPLRRAGIFLVLFLIIGPGLIVNVLLKDHWGRPRPADIVTFGGPQAYQPFWERGVAGQGKSFPSGHASVGFFILAPFFLLRKRSPRWALFWLILGLAYGVLMGLGRIIQGGHFASDVLASGVIIYLTGLLLFYLLRLSPITERAAS